MFCNKLDFTRVSCFSCWRVVFFLFFLDFGFLVVFYFFYETLYSLCCWGHNHICLSIYIYVRAMYIICTHEQHIGNTYMYILYVMCCNVLHPLPPPDGYQLSQGTSSPWRQKLMMHKRSYARAGFPQSFSRSQATPSSPKGSISARIQSFRRDKRVPLQQVKLRKCSRSSIQETCSFANMHLSIWGSLWFQMGRRSNQMFISGHSLAENLL